MMSRDEEGRSGRPREPPPESPPDPDAVSSEAAGDARRERQRHGGECTGTLSRAAVTPHGVRCTCALLPLAIGWGRGGG
eukprot:gene28664-19079_t